MADIRGTILIVDGEPATIEMLSDDLGGKRLGVACARNLDEALAAPMVDDAETPAAPVADSTPFGLRYTLALEVFRATRPFSREAGASVGTGLEQAALAAMQRGVGSEKAEVIRALNQVRTRIRFARDLGDIGAETAGRLDERKARARGSVGLS
jgi:hypothetical protein